MEANKKAETSNIKSYKLNKSFENSVYPLERELKAINNNTIASTMNTLAGAVFSGVGTSILFQEECLPELLDFAYNYFGFSEGSYKRAIGNILVVLFLFVLLYLLGSAVNMRARRKGQLYKRKKSNQGRSELKEIFHKSIINDIVTGLSFVDKAEELDYKGEVSNMYLYEAVYYFVQAKIQMEEMELLNPEKTEIHEKFVNEVGKSTIGTTCNVFYDGLQKLQENIPGEAEEKKVINEIIQSIEPYLQEFFS